MAMLGWQLGLAGLCALYKCVQVRDVRQLWRNAICACLQEALDSMSVVASVAIAMSLQHVQCLA
jgi:hypothetical protein